MVACPTPLDRGGSIPTPALFRKGDWWVSDVPHALAASLTRRWHYSRGCSITSVYAHGLFPRNAFWDEECRGVALWMPPTKVAAQTVSKDNWRGVLALSRLAIADEIPCNAESYLIRHSMQQIDRSRWPCLVSYADEWQEHKGTIYRAAGWTFVGKTKPARTYVINGRMVCKKAGPKTRSHSEMLALGAECIGKFARLKFVHVV